VFDQAEWSSPIATFEDALRLHHHQPGTLTGLSQYLQVTALSGYLWLGRSPAFTVVPARHLTVARGGRREDF